MRGLVNAGLSFQIVRGNYKCEAPTKCVFV